MSSGQPEDVQYWRMVVLDDLDVKTLLVRRASQCTICCAPWRAEDDRDGSTLPLVEGDGRRYSRTRRNLPYLPTRKD